MTNAVTELHAATIEAEESLLGAILVESSDGSRQAIEKISTILKPEYFYIEKHRAIYEAMLSCPLPPHQVNIPRQMLTMNTLEDGITKYLSYLISRVPCSLDYMDYTLAVKSYGEQRQVDYGKQRHGKPQNIIRGAI